jgi:hypothetical protein
MRYIYLAFFFAIQNIKLTHIRHIKIYSNEIEYFLDILYKQDMQFLFSLKFIIYSTKNNKKIIFFLDFRILFKKFSNYESDNIV